MPLHSQALKVHIIQQKTICSLLTQMYPLDPFASEWHDNEPTVSPSLSTPGKEKLSSLRETTPAF